MSSLGRDINIGPRLVAAFMAVALLTLVSGSIGLVGFQRASAAAAVLLQDAEMIQNVQEIRVAVAALQKPPTDFLLTGDPAARDQYQAAIEVVRLQLDNYSLAHRSHAHSTQHALSADELIAATAADVDRLARLEPEIFAASDQNQNTAPIVELEALVQGITSRLNQLLQNAEEDSQSAELNLAAAERSALIGLTSSALLAIVMAIGLALAFTRSISGPLSHLAEAAERIAEGDLSSPVAVRATGEIGWLAEVFERMRQTLIRERGQLRMLAVLEERDRIGREMHDGLAQVLGYVNTKAQAVGEFLKAGDPGSAERQIEELVSAAREAYTDAREVIVGLRLNGADQRELSRSVNEYIIQFARRNEIETRLEVAGDWSDEHLSATDQVQLLRIIQEALTNVRKHASAEQVTVSLGTEAGQAVIRVKDDGRGFNLSRLLRPDYSHYGLRTMRERTQAIDGHFRIESTIGQGTCIIVRVPMRSADEGGSA
jgi:nitrate/nitrite-specific signal transduction histidine kinase